MPLPASPCSPPSLPRSLPLDLSTCRQLRTLGMYHQHFAAAARTGREGGTLLKQQVTGGEQASTRFGGKLIPHLRHLRACGRDRSRGGQAASTPLRHLTSQADVLHPSRHHQSALTPNLHHQIGTERGCGHECESWHAASATEGTSPEYHQRPSWRSERGASVRRAAKTGQSQGSW